MKRNRRIALLLSLIMAWLTIPFTGLTALAEEAPEETTLIIHFKPEDDRAWNLWVWPEGGDGAVYEFTGEDAFGKVAKVTLPGVHRKVGFIVRTDAWDKYGGDRMVDTGSGLAEVWVTGPEATATEPPSPDLKAGYDNLSVTFHYKRLDGNYEGWNLWVWPQGGEGREVAFTGEDDFGKIAEISFSGSDLKALGYIVKRSDGDNAWAEKDGNEDRYITSFDENGQAHVWVVSGDPTTYYNPHFAHQEAKIVSASLTGFREILVKVNKPMGEVTKEMVSLSSGTVASVEKLDDYSLKITTEEDVDFRSTTEISLDGYGSAVITMGSLVRSDAFDERYATKAPLGALYGKDMTSLRVWAPTASKVELVLYESYEPDAGVADVLDMTAAEDGTWSKTLKGDRHLTAYSYRVHFPDGTVNDSQDPYAKAVVANGDRSVIIDLSQTDPEAFNRMPAFTANEDAVIYEAHVRDFSIDESSGIFAKGKYAGLIEEGTVNSDGDATGIDYLTKLGISHVQFLPIFDYASINELSSEPQYNWGYDPKNYNAPEGSYASDVIHPEVRIGELKAMIKGLHDKGLRVIMDVVYNHVYSAGQHAFEKIVPGYYFRYNADGSYTNATGVGNDTASERAMMRRFIVDSVSYWAKEYKLDGFRFDLMGIHDVETMNQVRSALNDIDPSIITLGEGWNMGTHPEEVRAIQKNADQMPKVAHFNDSFRDAVKGSVFNAAEGGFVQGAPDKEEILAINVKGAEDLPETMANYADPEQVIQYVEAHDNLTLFDKLMASSQDDEDSLRRRHLLATSMVVLSQGVPFIHAGQEFLRTKDGNHNSYNAGDEINALDWDRMGDEEAAVNYFKGLLALRASDELFRLKTYDAIDANMEITKAEDGVIAYELGDYLVIFNAREEKTAYDLPKGKFEILAENNRIHLKKGNKNKKPSLHIKKGGKLNKKAFIEVFPLSTTVLKKTS